MFISDSMLEGIRDLLRKAWTYGKSIKFDGGIDINEPWNPEDKVSDGAKQEFTERFSVALKYIHDKKIKGDYKKKSNNLNILLISGSKTSGKFWRVSTNGTIYNIEYGKCSSLGPDHYKGRTMTKTFGSINECHQEVLKKVGEKMRKGYKKQNDDESEDDEYNDEYVKLAKLMDESMDAKLQSIKIKQFGAIIKDSVDSFDENICSIISTYCNEDRIDYYSCDKLFGFHYEFITKLINRLQDSVKQISDKTPGGDFMNDMPFVGIFGDGEGFEICQAFSAEEMKQFASRMIDRLLIGESNDELDMIKKHIFTGISGGDKNKNGGSNKNRKRKMNEIDDGDNGEPCAKKRKLTNNEVDGIRKNGNEKKGDNYSDEVLSNVSYWLSASNIKSKETQDIVLRKIFYTDPDKFDIEGDNDKSYEGHHAINSLCFGLNAAAMNRGVIAKLSGI